MKKLSLITIAALCLFSIISSCKKDKTDDATPTTSTSTVQNSISKHWVVGDKSGRISNTSGYLWFEFNSNNKFIIAKTNGTYISGDYTISSDGKTITLINFGVITITSVSSTDFNFSLRINGTTSDIIIFSTSSTPIASSSKTDLLCKTWKINKLILDSITHTYPDSTVTRYEVIFSKYGTYFVTTAYKNGGTTYLNRKWQWKDTNETVMCYGDSLALCDGQHEVTVTELTSSSLKMAENNAIYKYKYELSPL